MSNWLKLIDAEWRRFAKIERISSQCKDDEQSALRQSFFAGARALLVLCKGYGEDPPRDRALAADIQNELIDHPVDRGDCSARDLSGLGMTIAPMHPTKAMIDAAWESALAEDAAGVWQSMMSAWLAA